MPVLVPQLIVLSVESGIDLFSSRLNLFSGFTCRFPGPRRYPIPS
jgi:hypothetical protein